MRIALNAGARVVGVNNRNLHTFELDLETTERVALVAADMSVPWQVCMCVCIYVCMHACVCFRKLVFEVVGWIERRSLV